MEAFSTSIGIASSVAGVLGVVVLAGFGVTRLPVVVARFSAWGLAVAAFVAVDLLASDAPAGFRMLALCGAMLYGMKAVVGVEGASTGDRLSLLQWISFAVLWFGMRPAVFARPGARPLEGADVLLRRGSLRFLQGAVLILAAIALGPDRGGPWPPAILCMVGSSLVFHFGLFAVLAACWRFRGVNTKALFRAPLLSTSLREFWGRRWNLAFSEMAAAAVFRPLRVRFGARTATVLAFLFSGLLHELAISAPVRAGWGLPFTYFVIHATLLQVEDALARRGRPVDGVPWVGRYWTMASLAVPFPVLFHVPFQAAVIWPLFGA